MNCVQGIWDSSRSKTTTPGATSHSKMALNEFLQIDRDTYPYVFMKNADILLKSFGKGVIRCKVYLPEDAVPFGSQTYPVIATYGPCLYS
ncbi:hypothetical protein BJX99DRAFT_160590 [Aspergillus californicus]